MNLNKEVPAEGSIIRWAEVFSIHKTRNGIYQQKGRLISLLTDLGRISKCYPDIAADDGHTLFYTGSGRRGNQKLDILNRALIEAIREKSAVPLFCKIEVNCWKYMGEWRVCDAEYVFDKKIKRMIWRFVLKRVGY